MESINKTDTASDALTLNFPNQEHLSKAVAGGTSYQIGDQVFVVFILPEEDGCTICWARGDSASEPKGVSFTRYLWLPSLGDAKETLLKVESVILNTLSSENATNI